MQPAGAQGGVGRSLPWVLLQDSLEEGPGAGEQKQVPLGTWGAEQGLPEERAAGGLCWSVCLAALFQSLCSSPSLPVSVSLSLSRAQRPGQRPLPHDHPVARALASWLAA